MSPYIKVNGRYSYDDLSAIFESTDAAVAPSIWYETFGFTVLEAMSFGVPVIVSGNVGAKDIIPSGAGVIIEDISVDKLYSEINSLTPKKLGQMNQVICEKFDVPTIKTMSRKIKELCYEREK
jgi:glycosyltransferase involved in cell wall biosynthesis